jgi:hypothetical protein
VDEPPRPLAAAVADLLATDSPDPVTFLTMVEQLYTRRFSGAVIVHFKNGVPKVLEFANPVKVQLHGN